MAAGFKDTSDFYCIPKLINPEYRTDLKSIWLFNRLKGKSRILSGGMKNCYSANVYIEKGAHVGGTQF